MGCGTNIVPGFQEANRKVNIPKDELVYNKLMDESVYEPTANTPQDIIEAQRTVRHIQETGKHPDDGAAWRKLREDGAKERKTKMAQPDSLVFAASQVKEGKMSVKKFRELVQKSDSPVTPMQEVPELVSVTNLARALDTGKSGKGRIVGLPGIEIQQGTRVGLRLDIPAYQDRNTWVNAIHFNEKVEGSRPGNAYSTASAGTNVIFGQHSKKAIKVATGIAKSPFAVMDVEWQNQTPEQTHKEITAALEDSKQPESRWTQIGMNPNRSGFFYDKATFLPVSSASRVLQVGALVMAQDVQYVGREGATMFSPKKESQPDLFGENSQVSNLTEKERENYNKLTEQENEAFEYPNRRVGPDSLTKEDIKGLYNRTLAQTLSDEGVEFVSEKGIPKSVLYTEGHEYAGSWSPGQDIIFINVDPMYAAGGIVKDNLNRVILHEHGHFIMNRLLRMRMVKDKKVRETWNAEGTRGIGNVLEDITDFTPKFKEAFLRDRTNLGLNRDDKQTLLNISIQHDLEVTYGGSEGIQGAPTYDGRLEGYYDIMDAMTLGSLHTNYNVSSGHSSAYYEYNANVDKRFGRNRPYHEAAANLFEAKFNKDQYAWNRIKKDMPNLAKFFDNLINEYKGQTKMFLSEDLYGNETIVENTHARDY
jgi:hypothetical protein